MVIGIIGYTQGVSAVSRPAVNANRNALAMPLLAASANVAACAVADAQQRQRRGPPRRRYLAAAHEASAASATSRFSSTLRSPRSKPSLT